MSTNSKAPLPSYDATFLVQMRPALLKYFKRKTGNTAEAEDLTQDVLVRSLTYANWKSPAEAKGYIFRSAVNRWRDRHRRHQAKIPTVEWNDEIDERIGSENPLERVLIVREEAELVLHTLDQMTERTRTVLVLSRIEQMKPPLIASMLGISERAVHKHLAKALDILMRTRSDWENPA